MLFEVAQSIALLFRDQIGPQLSGGKGSCRTGKTRQAAKAMTHDPRRKFIVPKRNWMQRNPRLFVGTVTTTALLIFFSKPLYDAFFAPALPAKEFRSFRIGPK